MKRIILILIIALIAMTTLLADTVTSQTSRDSRGGVHGYVYKSYYPNNTGAPSWNPIANEGVSIVVRDGNDNILSQYSCNCITDIDGYYTTNQWGILPPNSDYTVSVTCHGLTKRGFFVNCPNRIDFYIDVEF